MNDRSRQLSTASGTFVVLGAYGGIGSALARALAGRGARLLLAGRDGARLDAVAEQAGGDVHECDTTDFDAVDRCLARASELGDGRVAGVACCVGSLLLEPAHRVRAEAWHEVLGKNLTSAFATVRAAGKHCRSPGSVVLFSSAAATIGLAHHEAIAAAKAGVEGLVRSSAASYASRGLRFNAVAPGMVRTPLTWSLTRNERTLEASERMHPLRRIGEPDDIVSAAVWLLDPANSWVTGQVLHVDGGIANLRPLAST